jgi:hypothetical protein
MTGQIDLEKAADAEVAGVLAVRRGGKQTRAGHWTSSLAPAQRRALSELARGLVQAARQAGAQGRRVTWGDVVRTARERQRGSAFNSPSARRLRGLPDLIPETPHQLLRGRGLPPAAADVPGAAGFGQAVFVHRHGLH